MHYHEIAASFWNIQINQLTQTAYKFTDNIYTEGVATSLYKQDSLEQFSTHFIQSNLQTKNMYTYAQILKIDVLQPLLYMVG